MDIWPHKFEGSFRKLTYGHTNSKVASDIREEDINSHTEQF